MRVPRTYIVSYATKDFFPYLENLLDSARGFGYENFFPYTYADLIRSEFFKRNKSVLKQKRGAGYWLWKSFFISEVLAQVEENAIVFYIDSGSKLIADPAPLITIAQTNESGIVAFDCKPLKNYQWAKRDAFILMDLYKDFICDAHHVIATTMLFRNTPYVRTFVKEWLGYCKNPKIIKEATSLDKLALTGFIRHMSDQAIFSLLCAKYKIETYRNPSKWGNYLKMLPYRSLGEWISAPYLIGSPISSYSSIPQTNSPYDTIFEFNLKNSKSDKISYGRWGFMLNKIPFIASIYRRIKRIYKGRQHYSD